jgi:hypothetical protein
MLHHGDNVGLKNQKTWTPIFSLTLLKLSVARSLFSSTCYPYEAAYIQQNPRSLSFSHMLFRFHRERIVFRLVAKEFLFWAKVVLNKNLKSVNEKIIISDEKVIKKSRVWNNCCENEIMEIMLWFVPFDMHLQFFTCKTWRKKKINIVNRVELLI